MNVLIAILGLELLVVVHEAGHFFTAKAVGMKPQRFYIGFPPALAKVNWRGVEYGLGAIPLGGFVSLPGMQRPAPTDVDTWFSGAVRQEPKLTSVVQALKRALEADDIPEAQALIGRLEVELDEADLHGTPARLAKRGLNELRNGLTGTPYWSLPAWKRVAVSFAGPAVNLALALALLTTLSVIASGGYRIGFAFKTTKSSVTSVVDAIQPGSPAQQVGLRPGDRVVGVDGRRLTPQGIHDTITASGGRPVTITVERGGRVVALGPVRPRAVTKLSVPAAAKNSVRVSWAVLKGTGVGLGHLFTGRNRHELAGPVGVVQISSTAASHGVEEYLWLLGLISLSLGAFNLLPVLPLDGGHILLSSIEGFRRRALGRAVYERFAALGIALVLVLAFIILTSDIGRLGGG
ncbi:MAG: site-2 protease family protein [Thermoleophilia bacterium]